MARNPNYFHLYKVTMFSLGGVGILMVNVARVNGTGNRIINNIMHGAKQPGKLLLLLDEVKFNDPQNPIATELLRVLKF